MTVLTPTFVLPRHLSVSEYAFNGSAHDSNLARQTLRLKASRMAYRPVSKHPQPTSTSLTPPQIQCLVRRVRISMTRIDSAPSLRAPRQKVQIRMNKVLESGINRVTGIRSSRGRSKEGSRKVRGRRKLEDVSIAR